MSITEEQPRAGTPRLVLASRSPRRRELLDDAGIRHEVRLADLDDGDLAPGTVSPACWVAALAYLKARAVADEISSNGDREGPLLVLGADTVCVAGGEVVGQPPDRAEAERIIRLFENAEHDVLTGVALVDETRRLIDLFIDRARVRVGRIGPERTDEYLDSGGWRGKAGAYNLFERLEAGWPIEFEGDATTIVGLPMRALARRLRSRGLTG